MSLPVVVSGLGVVGAAGVGAAPLLGALERGVPPATDVDRSAGYHDDLPSRSALLVGEGAFREWISPLAARRMSSPSRWAVVAARTALAGAGVKEAPEPDPSLAVSLATAFGPSEYTQRLLDQVYSEGPEAMSPSLFTECVANAPASRIAISCRAGGAAWTLCGREAGALQAVARGASAVARGRARAALAGAVDEITPLLHAILARFGALAAGRNGTPERARPFDETRNGYLAAEGAAVAYLEDERSAVARGARILARVAGWAEAFDPTASRAGWGRGAETLARGLGRCLEQAGRTPEEVDLIVSGASGSVTGDRLEALVLRRVWSGEALPPVVTPKSVTGEYGGSFLAAAILALSAGRFAGPDGFSRIDPELGIAPHGGPLPEGPRRALVTSVASGGPAAWVLLESP